MVPVIKREFTEAVGSKAFLIGTILGPLLIFGLFGLQFLVLAKGGGGEHRIALLDATERGIGERVVQQLNDRGAATSFIERATYMLTVETPAAAAKQDATTAASQRVVAKELDGFLWIPPEVMTGAAVEYEGSNAQNSQVTGELQRAVQRVVQSERLRTEGIDEERLGGALQAVDMNIVKTGERGEVGNPVAAMLLAFGMAFAIYIVVIMYGQSIMSSVQEEKRDRIVELIVSSVRARDLLVGKVLGIGAAGVLQMLIWVAAAGLLLTQGALIAGALGAGESTVSALTQGRALPSVPLSVGVAFVLYFAGGFFLFATMFAVVGAIVTNAQEAQQFVFPILMPFILGLFIAMSAAENPNSTVALIGSLVPFTSPMVMPVRASVAGVELWQLALSLVLLFATAAGMIWIAAKIYRVAIFATGQKPTGRELLRWMRAA
jgi:ABC-2 type transport system permease protein